MAAASPGRTVPLASLPEDASILHQFAANLAAEAEQSQLLRKLQRAERHHADLRKELEQVKQRILQLRDERDLLMDRVYELEVATLEFSSGSSDEEDRPLPGPPPSLGIRGKRNTSTRRQHEEEEPLDELDMTSELDEEAASLASTAHPAKRTKTTTSSLHGKTDHVDQKKKRVVKTAEAAAATPRRVAAFPTDEDGQPILPLTVGVVTLHSAGQIVSDRPSFHNKRYIWPAGFHSSRPYMSAVDPETQTVYHNRILDGGTGPLFDVYAEDYPEQHYQAPTPTGAWTAIVKAVNAVRGREYVNSASGPDFFGLSNSTISMIIENLPGASQCTQYQRKVYEAAPPKGPVSKTSAMATLPSTENAMEADGEPEEDLILDAGGGPSDGSADVHLA